MQAFGFRFGFGASDLFRASDFEFRILAVERHDACV